MLTACNKAEPTTPEESDITEETTAEEETTTTRNALLTGIPSSYADIDRQQDIVYIETLGDFQAELEDITHSFKTFLGLEESEYVYENLY